MSEDEMPTEFNCPKCGIKMDRWGGTNYPEFIERVFRCPQCGGIYYATYELKFIGIEARGEHFDRVLGKKEAPR